TYINDENIFLGNVNIPNTGGWQNWQTVKQTVKVNAGNTNLYIYIQNKSMNINWIRISKIEAETSALIQAEDYSVMKGIATEATTDVGGGLNITDAETGDSLMYDNINFPSSGTYLIEYRVASLGGGRMLSYLNDEKILLGEVKTPNTRGLQNWQTVAQTVEVNEGTTNLFLYIQAGPLNINWIRITKIDDAALTPVASAIIAPQEIEDVALLYPNPVTDVLFFTKDVKGGNVSVVDSQTGNVVLSQKIDDNSLNVSSLNRGIYFIIFDVDGKQIVKRFIKK
ncbi:MAG: carbohydrate-binding protein, partial [Flavobacterium sp.]